MPGFLKVSGSQKTVASPYIKVGGAWKNVSVAYVKVNGAWKQWYAAQVTDTFDRANASSLGTVSNGVTSWTNVTGSWGITNNQATTSSYSSYPLAKVQSPTNQNDFVESIDIVNGSGGGLGFWITDTNNWYAVVTNTVQNVSYSCPSGGTYNPSTGNCEVPWSSPAYCTTSSAGVSSTVTSTYGASSGICYSISVGLCSDSIGRSACSAQGGSCSGYDCRVPYVCYSCNPGDSLNGSTCTTYSEQCAAGTDSSSTC